MRARRSSAVRARHGHRSRMAEAVSSRRGRRLDRPGPARRGCPPPRSPRPGATWEGGGSCSSIMRRAGPDAGRDGEQGGTVQRARSGANVSGSTAAAYSRAQRGSASITARAAASTAAASRSPEAASSAAAESPRWSAAAGGPVLGPQVGVAAAHRQAVGLAHRRPDDQLDVVEVEVAHQAAHDGHLLGVLLAEDRPVGAGRQEQLGHHRRHPAEVLGARRALQAAAGAADRHGRGEARRVDLLGARREHEGDPALPAPARRRAPRPAGSGEILAGGELGRVDEQRHHNGVAVAPGQVDEGEVPLVEGPHRRHERDPAPVGAQGGDGSAQVGDRADDVHGDLLRRLLQLPRSGCRASRSGRADDTAAPRRRQRHSGRAAG